MAIGSTQNTGNSKKQWDVLSVDLLVNQSAVWGIHANMLPQVIILMKEKGIGKFADTENTLSFINLKKLVAWLYEEDMDTADLSKAAEQFINAAAPAAKADETVYKDLQLTINNFPGLILSPVVADGRWGPASQKALDAVQQFYNLPAIPPNQELLNLLQLIANRLFGIKSNNDQSTATIQKAGFATVKRDRNFELLYLHGNYTLKNGNKDIILFQQYKAAFTFRFDAITACLMLLQLQNGKPVADVCDLLLLKDGREWQTPDNFTSKNKNDFYFTPDFTVNFSNQATASLTIKYIPKTTAAIEFMAFYMCGTFAIAATMGEDANNDELGKTLVFNAAPFFTDESKKADMNGTTVLTKADYIKFFILRRKREKYISEISNQSKDILLPPEFYQLITTRDEDVLATACFGIDFTPVKEPKNNFREVVKKLYTKQKITVADDLQKERWGGKSSSNGKTLTVAVESVKSLPGLYSVAISIHTNDTALQEAAIFLHDTFKNEIEFVLFKNGIAEINVDSYEAFTVGAYTEDGTMLELDLNEVTGYPKGFYYDDPPAKFKSEVEELDKRRKITVPDDLQKNRWEGKAMNNGKNISATVEKKLIPGLYKVDVRIEPADSKSTLHGFVAFFLHDSFKSKIRYKKVIDNIARITLTAYETFTIGACTQDGTLLELDLQKQTGYPAGFYYKEEQSKTKQNPKAKPKPKVSSKAKKRK